MPSPAVASAPTTPTVTQSSPVEAPASPQLLLVQANTIQLIWKDNSCSVDAALVALYAATSGLRCFPSSDLDGLRTEVFGRFGDASLGDPLQYGKQQALQDIMLRVTQMFYIRTECEIQFQRRTVPATCSVECRFAEREPRPLIATTLNVYCSDGTITEMFQNRISEISKSEKCVSFPRTEFRTPAHHDANKHAYIWVDAKAEGEEREKFRAAHLHITGNPVPDAYECDAQTVCAKGPPTCHGRCALVCGQDVDSDRYQFSVHCTGQRWYDAVIKRASHVLTIQITINPGAKTKLGPLSLVVDGAVWTYQLRSIIQKKGAETSGHFRTLFLAKDGRWYVHDGLVNGGMPKVIASGCPKFLKSPPQNSFGAYYDAALVYCLQPTTE